MKSHLCLAVLMVTLGVPSSQSAEALYGPLPGGYWQNLLHLGADFQNDHLNSTQQADRDFDFLSGYGGQTSQQPYPGLVYNLAAATTGDKNLTWTAHYRSDGVWQPSNKDNYVKYWHLYIIVPGSTGRDVRYHFRHDDDLRMWVNGTLMVSRDGWDGGSVQTQNGALYAGVNAVTIKLREGGGGDIMAMRVTDQSNTNYDDLSFTLSLGDFTVDAGPATAVGETTATLNGELMVIGAPPDEVLAVWATDDWEDELADWQTHGQTGTLGQPDPGPISHPVIGLTPDTVYHYRFVATNATDAAWSDPVTFKTLGGVPVVDNGAGATPVGGLWATLTGTLTGGAKAFCSIHLGTDPDQLDTEVEFGEILEGPFQTTVTDLALDTTYYYRAFASNAYAVAWATDTISFTTAPTSAETLTWIGQSGDNWNEAANWTPALGVFPQSLDTAIVINQHGGAHTVNLNGNQAVRELRVGQVPDTGNYTFNAAGQVLTLAGGSLLIDDHSSQLTYTFNNSFLLAADAAIYFLRNHNGNIGHTLNLGPIETGGYDVILSAGWADNCYFNGVVSGGGNLHIAMRSQYGRAFIRSASTLTGTVTIESGTRSEVLTIDGASGSLTGSPLVAVLRGSTLELGSTGSSLNDDGLVGSGDQGRIRNDATVSLRRGGLRLTGRNSVNVMERIGPLRVGGGYAWVNIVNGSSAEAELRVGSLVRDADSPAIVYVSSGNNNLGGASRLVAADDGASLPMIGGINQRGTDRAIVPFMVTRSKATNSSRPDSFLRYDTTIGLVPLDPATAFVTATVADYDNQTFPAVHADGFDNVRLPYQPFQGEQATKTLTVPSGNTTINALLFDGDGTLSTPYQTIVDVTGSGTDSLTVRSGLIVTTRTGSGGQQTRPQLTVPTVYFGAGGTGVPGVIAHFCTGGNQSRTIINSKLVGDRGLTFYHASHETDSYLGGDNSGLTGRITIAGTANRGVEATHRFALGAGGNDLYVEDGARLIAKGAASGGISMTVKSISGHGTVRRDQNLNVGGDGTGGASQTLKLLAGGTLSPGDPDRPGILTLDNFTTVAMEGGTLAIRVRRRSPQLDVSTVPVRWDRLAITAGNPALTLSGTELVVTVEDELTLGDAYRIITVAGSTAVSGTFANPNDKVIAEYDGRRYTFDIRYGADFDAGDNNDVGIVVAAIDPLQSGSLFRLR